MDKLIGPITRIIMRYLAGILVAVGGWIGLAPEATQAASDAFLSDPDVLAVVTMFVGAAIGGVSELAYAAAKKVGGAT